MVYGVPAIVAAIDRRVRVTAERRDGVAIRVVSDLGVAGEFEGRSYRPIVGGAEARRQLEPIRIAAQSVLDSLGVGVGLDITIRSEIPASVGLGSSGAIAVATVAAVGRLLGARLRRRDVFRLSYDSEKFIHRYPSGIDQTISTYGGVIRYVREKGIESLRPKALPPIVIGNTGILRSTGDLVAKVRRRRDEDPRLFGRLMEKARRVCELAVGALERGDLEELGGLMDENQRLLDLIGVSHPVLDGAIDAARRAGALGAKLTGAGGGGCMIALAAPEGLETVIKAIGGVVRPMVARITRKGVISFLLESFA